MSATQLKVSRGDQPPLTDINGTVGNGTVEGLGNGPHHWYARIQAASTQSTKSRSRRRSRRERTQLGGCQCKFKSTL
eukprot:363754-Chlamydomonas_euryale.AAC.6